MKIFLSPQVSVNIINFSFDGSKVSVSVGGLTDTFDFTGLPDGKLELYDWETGENLIKTKLPVNPIISAEKKDGILYLELLNWISEDASYSERFPEWIDAKDYVAPKEVESVENERLVEESGTNRPGGSGAGTDTKA